jgi:nitrogen fixation NifU-like protein
MSEYNDLYQQVLLEHNKNPRNFTVLASANHYSLGKNPLCGDQFAVYVNLDDSGNIAEIGFQGDGCAIAKASASIMTTQVKGKTKEEAHRLKTEFQKMLTGELNPESDEHHLGKLTMFSGVQEYPVRVKCATLAWHTLDAALKGEEAASTEN